MMNHWRRNCPGAVCGIPTRRSFLQHSSAGFGWLALMGMVSHASAVEPK
ncbi:MAG: twin-arginine translocation signal domain-containing protein, partial [Pirellula sp.]